MPIYPLGHYTNAFASPTYPLGHHGAETIGATLRVKSVSFTNDQERLLVNETGWGDGFQRYPKPEWPAAGREHEVKGHPVSYTKGNYIAMSVEVEYTGKRRIKGMLRGSGRLYLRGRAEPIVMRFDGEFQFKAGVNKYAVLSHITLPSTVNEALLTINWWFQGDAIAGHALEDGIHWRLISTDFSVFITWDEPSDKFGGITFKRMQHSVHSIGKTDSTDPHTIVRKLMSRFPAFHLYNNPANAWQMAEPTAAADCRTIVRYVLGVLAMAGIPGNASCVLVYEKIGLAKQQALGAKKHKSIPMAMQLAKIPGEFHFDPTEDVAPVTGRGEHMGLNNPLWVHPNGKWTVVLFTKLSAPNAFEACLKFNDGKTVRYYPGGVDLEKHPDLHLTSPKQVLDVAFFGGKLGWAVLDKGDPKDKDDDTMVPVGSQAAIKTYPRP